MDRVTEGTRGHLARKRPGGEWCPIVPWCETCSRFYNPNSLAPDGTCMTCGAFIAEPPAEGEEEADAKVPWHFWILVGALVIYLGWRLVQTIIWAVTGHWPG
jgi:hypothetical protein